MRSKRNFIFIVFVVCGVLAQSCINSDKNVRPVKQADSISNNPANSKMPANKQEEGINDTSRIISLIKENPGIDSSSTFEVVRIFGANGYKYALVGVNTGTCHRSFLLMFGADNKIKKCAELEMNCDSDLSRASYRYKNFTEESDTAFKVEVITQTVLDSSLIGKNGRLKNGLTMDDVKCVNDTVVKMISPGFFNSDVVPQWPKIWK